MTGKNPVPYEDWDQCDPRVEEPDPKGPPVIGTDRDDEIVLRWNANEDDEPNHAWGREGNDQIEGNNN